VIVPFISIENYARGGLAVITGIPFPDKGRQAEG